MVKQELKSLKAGPIQLRWLKEWKGKMPGDVALAGPKSAENFVNQGVAEYIVKEVVRVEDKLPSEDVGHTPINEELEQERKEKLLLLKYQQEFEGYKKNEINWLEGDYWDSWDKIKGHWHKIIKPGNEVEFDIPENPKIEKWFFLAHNNDEIEGKPQLVHDVMQRIPLIKLTSKINKEGTGKNKVEWKTLRYLFFDERYDKRYDGALIDSLSLDFWVYRIKYEGKEYYIYSQEKLPDGKCKIKGMGIDLSDVSELSNTLKIGSLSHIFIASGAEAAVKILPKNELVNFIKDQNLNLEKWLAHISQHPLGSINRFPVDIEILRSAFLLSGKETDWPLHLAIMGPAGTRKTMGHGESIYSKFDEEITMASATSYNLKGLIPSFRKSPPDPGYILKSHRIAIVDEWGKLIGREANKHDRTAINVMGELTDILEHKHRSGGSGNDFIDINPTAKCIFITNPVQGKETIYQHVGTIDPTTMGRLLWWVQDSEEQEFVLGDNGILRNPPDTIPNPKESIEISPHTLLSLYNKNIKIKSIVLKKCRGEYLNKDEFLTIYDSCNSFLSEIDDLRVNKLVLAITNIAKEPMKGVWNPRAYHQTKLLIDGLVKTRCLFDDGDISFSAKDIDYDWAERILVRMVGGWDTNLSLKQQ